MSFSAKFLVSAELVEDWKYFNEIATAYIHEQVHGAMQESFATKLMIDEYEFLYGVGSYEAFIFGGAMGL